MGIPILIYCAEGNKRFSDIAWEAGFQLGARLPNRTVYHSLYFIDQEWRDPNRERYMAALREHRPVMATVLDWEREEQWGEVMAWAEEAATHVGKYLVIIPKVQGGCSRIPEKIGGKEVVLGYSVPTRFGGTPLPLWEFRGRRVHLLGGSPQAQMREWSYLCLQNEVVSADGNMMNRMAMNCQYWVNGTAWNAHNRYWPQLWETDPEYRGMKDAPYEAFRRSCRNIVEAWRRI